MAKGVAADIDPLSLERQVCFALAVTNRAVLAVYRPLLEPLGLTHPQYLVMLALWDNSKANGEPLTVKDERTTLVKLTSDGRDLRRQALKVPPAVVERLGVELAELEQLREVLTRINTAAVAAGALDSERDR
jgi:DNA-binding MarR family transcriptional regulator